MRPIERPSAFRRDFKRIAAAADHRNIEQLLRDVLERLVSDQQLPEKNRDHQLSGRWSAYRECHVKPDILLIYRKPEGRLQLLRLGTHSELFRK